MVGLGLANMGAGIAEGIAEGIAVCARSRNGYLDILTLVECGLASITYENRD
ncbi:MAG: hypothetical protein V3U57_03100 [Robiginitomaculum sp.]